MFGIDAVTGRIIDKFTAGSAIYSSPVLDQDAVYFGTNSGEFYCVAFADDSAS